MSCKKCLSSIVCIVFVTVILFTNNFKAFALTSSKIYYSVDENVQVGNEFNIYINAENVNDLFGASFDLKYDTTLMEIIDVKEGSAFSGSGKKYYPVKTLDPKKTGVVSCGVLLLGQQSGINANGKLFIIRAKALKTGNVSLKTTDSYNKLDLKTTNVCIKLANSLGNKISSSSIAYSNLDFSLNPRWDSSKSTRYEEISSLMKYNGDWKVNSDVKNSAGSGIYTSTTGAYVEFTFVGNGIRWIGDANKYRGIAKVSIDGESKNIDTYYNGEQFQKVFFEKTWINYGRHKIKIEATGQKNISSLGANVHLDAFEVFGELPPSIAGRYEETSNQLICNGAWGVQYDSRDSGGSAKNSYTAGNYLELNFIGNGIRWISNANKYRGIAKVTLDGVAQNVDTYYNGELFQKVVFEKTGLIYGVHTIKIEVIGQKNVNSMSTIVNIDALEVLGQLPPAAVGIYQETSKQVTVSGTWNVVNDGRNSGGSAKNSYTAGAYIELKFIGNGINWIGNANKYRGIAKVTLDGVSQNVDTYYNGEQFQKVLFTKTGLSYGAHTLRITVTGQKNASSLSTTINVDALQVLNTVRYEEASSKVKYNGTWTVGADGRHSGGKINQSSVTGAYAEFTFRGTGIRWIGKTDKNKGIAKVTLDGVTQNVDNYYNGELFQKILLEKTGLYNGIHTIRIEVTGQKNTAALASTISIDALEVLEEVAPIAAGIYQETASQLMYYGNWTVNNDTRNSAGSAMTSSTAGSYIEFKFIGTGIKWIGDANKNRGIAKVTLDGVSQNIDTFYNGEQFQKVFFTKTGLPYGTHTIRIEVTGQKNASALASNIHVDSFEIVK